MKATLFSTTGIKFRVQSTFRFVVVTERNGCTHIEYRSDDLGRAQAKRNKVGGVVFDTERRFRQDRNTGKWVDATNARHPAREAAEVELAAAVEPLPFYLQPEYIAEHGRIAQENFNQMLVGIISDALCTQYGFGPETFEVAHLAADKIAARVWNGRTVAEAVTA